ncbi:hypothetical protein [Mycobacteroides abscessus]|uniref:hypothetical protein n=1 Tax=Mycobacteroides abscessus TaxID=36809 RepID=UPI001F19FCB9|nr:hypothetical protein [Mycobacteroides abscessus]
MMKPLAVLALTFGVGASTIGCSASGTPTAPLSSTISTTAPSRALVDAAAVWAEHPLPPCPDYPGERGGATPPGLSLPDHDSVEKQLAGVQSPGDVGWVRTKLGWLTQWLSQTRGGIIKANNPTDTWAQDDFNDYVQHVKAELQVGHDVSDSALDGDYPERCI